VGAEPTGSAEEIERLIRKDVSTLSRKAGLKTPRFYETRLVQEGKHLPGDRPQRADLYERLIHANIDNLEAGRPREALCVKLNLRDGYPDSGGEKRLGVLGGKWGLTVSNDGKQKGRSKQAEIIANKGVEILATLIREEIDERKEHSTWDDLLGKTLDHPTPRESPEPIISEADVSVDYIEATLALDNDGRVIGRESSFTVRPHRPLTAPITVVELNDDEFEVGNAVNCTVLDPNELQLHAHQLFTRAKELSSYDDEIASKLRKHTQVVEEDLRRLQERLGRINEIQGGRGLAHLQRIELPSLSIGEPWTFSYSTSYSRPKIKRANLACLYLGSAPSCWLQYLVLPRERRSFAISTSFHLSRVTLRIVSERPLKIVPNVESAQTAHLMSMPLIPLVLANYIARSQDGGYKHTFRHLPPDSDAALMWYFE
jgi:hypothetical protein